MDSAEATVDVVIECDRGQSSRTRLDRLGRSVVVRPLPPGVDYPCNYGYVEATRVADGEEGAWRVLYDRHAGWLLLRLRRRTTDPDVAAEAVHDTFVAVWRSAGAFRGGGGVGAWVWGIALRQLLSRLRRRPAVCNSKSTGGLPWSSAWTCIHHRDDPSLTRMAIGWARGGSRTSA